MIGVLAKIPAFRLGRRLGRPLVLPSSLTVSVLYACNSRCKSCRIWETKARVLSVEEYRDFRSLGRSPRWVTISGGEPFLRKDLHAVVGELWDACRPSVINLPTNASLPDSVESQVDAIASRAKGAKIIVNVSLDAIGTRHDDLRGLPGNFARAEETLVALRRLKARHANLTLGIHTVLSRHNEQEFPEICDAILALGPDLYIAEVAERRVELGTVQAEDFHLRARASRARSLISVVAHEGRPRSSKRS